MILIGIFVQRTHIVKQDFDAQLTNFMMKIALPCLIVSSMQGEFSVEELKNGGLLMLLSLAVQGVCFLIGQGGYLALGRGSAGRIFRFGAVYTNYSFMGFPVVEALYGSQGLFYYVMFLLPVRLLYYATAEPMLAPPELHRDRPGWRGLVKKWCSAPTLAALLGLVLYVTQLPLPQPVWDVMSRVGSVCSPMGMILCGITLGKYEFRRLLRPRYLVLPLVRNLVLPGLTWLCLRPLGLPPLLAAVVVIYTALPVSSLTAAFTIQYDPHPEARFESAGAVLISTLLSAVTIPLCVAVLGL